MIESATRIATTAAVAATIAFATPARADSTDVSPGDIADIADKLQLTPQQRKQIRTIHDDVRKATVKLRAEIEATGIDLRRELDEDAPNEPRVGNYIAKISQLEGRARQARILGWLRIRKLLRADQRKLMKQLQAKGRRGNGAHRHLARELARMAREGERIRREMSRARSDARREAMRARAEALRAKRDTLRKRARSYRRLKNPFRDVSKSSSLQIEATPWAKIYIDGKLAGTTPLRIPVRPGKHQIRARWKNRTTVRVVEVEPDSKVQLVLTEK